MTNAADPTLGLTPSLPFVYGTRPQNQWRLLPAPPRPTKDENPPNYQDHELIIADVGGGLNKVWGRIFPHYLGVDTGDSDRTSNANGLDPSYPGQLVLSTFMNSEAVWRGSLQSYCQCYIYTNLFIGSGSTANLSIYQENASAPGLAAVTFSPAGSIVSLTPLSFGGTAPRLCIGVIDHAAPVLNSGLTSDGTLNNATTLWGAIVSPLNANNPGTPTNLLYYSDGAGSVTAVIATVGADKALGTVATTASAGIAAGGYAVGIANVAVTPGSLVPRAVWVLPQNGVAAGMFGSGSPSPPRGDIWHSNLYGTDLQKLVTNLPYVTWCTINEGVLYYTDGFNVMMNDGKEQDLGWVYEREPDSDYKFIATGLGFARGQLVTAVSRLNLTTVASSQMWFEKYDPTAKVWQPISAKVTPNQTLTVSDVGPGYVDRAVLSYPMGSLPYSLKSQSMYMLPIASTGSEKDYYQFIGPPGYSHFWNYRFTAGSTKAGQKTEASGTWDSPALEIPHPLKGLPTVIIGIGIYGDVLAGGTGFGTTASSIQVQQFHQDPTGSAGTFTITNGVKHKVTAADQLDWDSRFRAFTPDQWDPFNRLKIRVTLTQDDSRTDWSPNGLPIVIKMRTFLDGHVSSG